MDRQIIEQRGSHTLGNLMITIFVFLNLIIGVWWLVFQNSSSDEFALKALSQIGFEIFFLVFVWSLSAFLIGTFVTIMENLTHKEEIK